MDIDDWRQVGVFTLGVTCPDGLRLAGCPEVSGRCHVKHEDLPVGRLGIEPGTGGL